MTYSIAVDFDGVLNSYASGFQGNTLFPDPPVPGAIEWLEEMAKHFKVIIHSARLSDDEGDWDWAALHNMRKWLEFNGVSGVTMNRLDFAQKPKALVYIDDRGYRFTGDNFPTRKQIHLELRPWNNPKPSKEEVENG